MPDQSRRAFLRNVSAGAVAVGAAAATPGILGGLSAASAGTEVAGPASPGPLPAGPLPAGPLPAGPLMAYIRDPGSGEISVMVGTRQVTYRDPGLAARLAQATQVG
ncbi:MAG: hypothetical protein ACRDY0_03775 [Acidimicrobiales bacterium]